MAEFLKSAVCCKGCGLVHATKSTKVLVYRTVFWQSQTAQPAAVFAMRALQVCSFRTTGDRLEQEFRHRIKSTAAAWRQAPAPRSTSDARCNGTLQVDAGYLKSATRTDGARWFAAVASKIVHADPGRNLAHAYSIGYDPWAGLRQQAFLGTAGIPIDQPVVVISDGGEDIAWACKLPAAKERVLDWFHIGMRFQHLSIAVQGLKGSSPQLRASIKRRILGAKWLLWHGHRDRCLQRLREIGHAKGSSCSAGKSPRTIPAMAS